jgi:quercetin dioxygenase-like cupin family protein
MLNLWKTGTVLTAVLAALFAGKVEAQSATGKPMWETLMRAPVPEHSLPSISVVTIPVPPAPPVPREPGAGHTHPGPVFAYILQGEIENHVDPYGPQVYKPGGFFYEAPLHVHRFLRNLSTTEPAQVLIFQEGADKSKAAPGITTLLEEPLLSTTNQEVSLLRLTLPAGALSDAGAHSGKGVVYVVEGKIETAGTTRSTGDVFLESADRVGLTFRNASGSEPAKLLLYQVNEKR